MEQGLLTLKLFIRWFMNVSQYGEIFSFNAREMSLTKPMAIEQRPGSSWLPRALLRNGLKGSMYFSNSSSKAPAIAPTVENTTSGTLDLGGTVERT